MTDTERIAKLEAELASTLSMLRRTILERDERLARERQVRELLQSERDGLRAAARLQHVQLSRIPHDVMRLLKSDTHAKHVLKVSVRCITCEEDR